MNVPFSDKEPKLEERKFTAAKEGQISIRAQ